MHGIGVVEGFFGPAWTWAGRAAVCEQLAQFGGGFYIYAPKSDAHLRKAWIEDHPSEVWDALLRHRNQCRSLGIQYGVGLSPFEIYAEWNSSSRAALRSKLQRLRGLDLDYLGLFFDDMKPSEELASRQIDIAHFVQSEVDATLLFCPAYYSDDPVLDRVFGPRPPRYLYEIGTGLTPEIEILWTGPKVISDEISAPHLAEVTNVLQRRPFIWDNYFANDGPKNCRKLSLKPFLGRTAASFRATAGWAVNPMNQAYLSIICLHQVVSVFHGHGGLLPNDSLTVSLNTLCTPGLKYLLLRNLDTLQRSLDSISSDEKADLIADFSQINDQIAHEIVDWLNGDYLVGPECLTN